MNKALITRANKAMICAAIEGRKWKDPYKVPPIEVIAELTEELIWFNAGRKTANYIESLLREAGLTYARPDRDRQGFMQDRIENAINFLRSHGFQVGVSAEKYIDVEKKLQKNLTM